MIHRFVLTGEVLPVLEKESNDVIVTHRALTLMANHLGVGAKVDVEDCGAAYRFLMALLSVTPGQWKLTGTDRLLQRPIEELIGVLIKAGAEIMRENDGWKIVGKRLEAAELTINCQRSSQFASALLLVAPKIGLQTLHVKPEQFGSVPYVQLTRLCTSSEVQIPTLPPVQGELGRVGDWSTALYWYAQALLHPENEYELEGLSQHSAQGDSIIAQWFAGMGLPSSETAVGVHVGPAEPKVLPPFEFDVADHPDVVPVMAALACLLSADFTFLHTRNLSYKESDRARHLARQLAPFAQIDIQEDMLRVQGLPRSQWPAAPYHFQTQQDHRLAMAFLLFGDQAVLDDTSCLRKSLGEYENLFD